MISQAMLPLFFRRLALSVPLFVFVQTTSAQNLIQGTDVGIHVFGTRPSIQVQDSRMGTLVHAYLRRQLGERTQQELTIGMGLVQGVNFKTRILPVDYRILAFPFNYSRGQLFPGIHYGDMYVYGGLGLVNSTPIEIPRPDDPMTVDAGPTLRGSSFLDLSTNWSFHAPVGIGTSIHLDDETQMVFNAGYHLSQATAFNGYFAMSVGLKFNKVRRPKPIADRHVFPVGMPSTALSVIPMVVPKTAVTVERFAPRTLYFESSVSTVRSSEERLIDEAVAYMAAHPRVEVVLRAHADSSGRQDLNAVLAEDRAWKTAVELMTRGIGLDRIRVESYGDRQPALENRSEEGRAMNRRLDLEMRVGTFDAVAARIESESSLVSLPETNLITFADYGPDVEIEPSAASLSLIHALARWMSEHPDRRLHVTAYHDIRGSEVTKRMMATAQASRIQRLLVEHGVDVTRIETVGVAGGPRRTELRRVAETR